MQAKIKKIVVIFLLLIAIISPMSVSAKNTYFDIDNYVQISTKSMASDIYEQCNNKSVCKNSDYLLGNVECECSTAWLLQKLLNYLRVLGPTIAVVLSSLDFAKAVVSSDEENMKKTQTKFIKRLILAVLLFLIPTVVKVILGLFGIMGSAATGGLV